MTRLGFFFSGVCVLAIFSMAFACASGDNPTVDSSVPTLTSGSGGGGGTGGTTPTPTGGTQTTQGTEPPTILPPVCGNDVIESGESCEGANLNNASCESLTSYAQTGTLSCVSCQYDTSMCYDIVTPPTDGGDTNDGGYGL